MIETWIIPCNVKVYNIVEHFKTRKTVVWKNSFTMKPGDTAYIYLGSPYGEIRYKCSVISDHVDDDTLKENSYAIPLKKSNNYYSKKEKYIVLELEKEFPESLFPLMALKENGLGQVQIQARADRKLLRYIMDVEAKLIDNERKAEIGGDNDA